MTELATQTRDVLSFGPFSLVASERLLMKDGAEVELGGRALDLLLRLVAHPHEPVGKRELMAEVWPDLTVGEGSLRFLHVELAFACELGQGCGDDRFCVDLKVGAQVLAVVAAAEAVGAEGDQTALAVGVEPGREHVGQDVFLACGGVWR